MSVFRRLAFWFAVLLGIIIMAADFGLAPDFFILMNRLPYADTAGHFILLGLLSLLVNLGFPSNRLGWLPIPKASLLLAALITLEELSQIFLANRSFSFSDLLANYAGIWLFGELGVLMRKKLQLSETHGME
jgi:polysaccharide biosynthesis protein VpsQ